jgi:hypothetical protein
MQKSILQGKKHIPLELHVWDAAMGLHCKKPGRKTLWEERIAPTSLMQLLWCVGEPLFPAHLHAGCSYICKPGWKHSRMKQKNYRHAINYQALLV